MTVEVEAYTQAQARAMIEGQYPGAYVRGVTDVTLAYRLARLQEKARDQSHSRGISR